MKTVLAAVGLVIISGVVAAYWGWQQLSQPLGIDEDNVVVIVPAGTTLSKVSAQLGQREILKYPRLWTLFARVTDQATRIQAGEYTLATTATPRTLLAQMVAGDVRLHSVTLIEGWRFHEALAAIRAHPAITAGELTPAEIMSALGKPDLHPEGQLLPETYHFPRGTSDLELLRQAHQALGSLVEKVWPARAEDLPLNDAYEALILASIVEKETALDTERAQIAGVFTRRLNTGMRLETDPTVIYGLGEGFDGNLRSRDLKADTPYNTYRRAGLPPTPIALASPASLRAALNPAAGDSLFFVATGKGDGSHYFSVTYDEHLAAVNRYLKRLKESR